MKNKTLAIVGCGKLAQIVAEALTSGLLPDYHLIGTYSRTFEKAERIAEHINNSDQGYTCTASKTMEELLAMKTDYIVEMASPAALREFALEALQNGSSIVTLSIGALADTEFYEEIKATARKSNTKVHLASGSIGGFDVMRTISLMGDSSASFKTEKGPDSLKGTSVYDESLQTEQRMVMEGNAAEAIELFPTKVNVAVAASLATTGPKNIDVAITSIPGFVGDTHRIHVENDQAHARIEVYGKTSDIAGWSVVNTLRNITAPIVF